jgi:nucleoside-diphosphate-sugar epimerase
MRVALSGGTGFLGRHVIQALVAGGHTVQLLVRAGSRHSTAHDSAQVDVTRVDLTQAHDLAKALRGCDVVVHAAAALTGDHATQHAATVEGTRTMLSAMAMACVKRVVGISSLSVYGYADLPHGATLTETTPLEAAPAGRDVYARCKLAQDALFQAFSKQPGCEAIVLRPGIFYDTDTLWQFSLGKPMGSKAWVVMGPLTPDCEAPLVHVADVAQAIVRAVVCDASLNGAVFNLIEQPAPTSHALLQALANHTEHPPLIRLPWWLHTTLARVAVGIHRLTGQRLPLPGLLNPVWLAARFTRVHYDASHALTQLGWQPAHHALSDLAKRTRTEHP